MNSLPTELNLQMLIKLPKLRDVKNLCKTNKSIYQMCIENKQYILDNFRVLYFSFSSFTSNYKFTYNANGRRDVFLTNEYDNFNLTDNEINQEDEFEENGIEKFFGQYKLYYNKNYGDKFYIVMYDYQNYATVELFTNKKEAKEFFNKNLEEIRDQIQYGNEKLVIEETKNMIKCENHDETGANDLTTTLFFLKMEVNNPELLKL
jgi:c-di-AMP phosphodiesterase-like protein